MTSDFKCYLTFQLVASLAAPQMIICRDPSLLYQKPGWLLVGVPGYWCCLLVVMDVAANLLLLLFKICCSKWQTLVIEVVKVRTIVLFHVFFYTQWCQREFWSYNKSAPSLTSLMPFIVIHILVVCMVQCDAIMWYFGSFLDAKEENSEFLKNEFSKCPDPWTKNPFLWEHIILVEWQV